MEGYQHGSWEWDDDKPREECGVVAFSSEKGSPPGLIQSALFVLQHRGQSNAGGAINHNGEIIFHTDVGLVDQALPADVLKSWPALTRHGVGHTRYSTSVPEGPFKNEEEYLKAKRAAGHPNIQRYGSMVNAAVLNGHMNNTDEILDHVGLKPKAGETDWMSFCRAVMHRRRKLKHNEDVLAELLPKVNGAFSLALLDEKDRIIAARDGHGFRPYFLGSRPDGWAVASETAALPNLGAQRVVRSIEQGEMLTLDGQKLFSKQILEPKPSRLCSMEMIYLTSPDSFLFGTDMHEFREGLGKRLAGVKPVDADVVIGVPDSGLPAADGYAQMSGIPSKHGIVKNNYVGRTFIADLQEMREMKARLKYRPIESVVRGNRLLVVDDSLVRGTTTRVLVDKLREAGALEVHIRVSSPLYLWSCFYGLDTGTRDQLVAARHSVRHQTEAAITEAIRQEIGADSLAYLPVDSLLEAIKNTHRSPASLALAGSQVINGSDPVCTACFTGNYPTEVPESWLQISQKP